VIPKIIKVDVGFDGVAIYEKPDSPEFWPIMVKNSEPVARSYVCLTKGHGGYCSCPCTIRGEYDHGTVKLIGYCGEARTDETFRLQEDGS
jgi:hypothetical protein